MEYETPSEQPQHQGGNHVASNVQPQILELPQDSKTTVDEVVVI